MYIFEASIFGIHIAPTWYWLMYAIGFIFCYTFVGKYSKIEKEKLDSLLFYIFLWVIGGGRLGYVLFYNPTYFLQNPNEIIALWNGWMSFHGGFLWVLIAVYIFTRKYRYKFFEITDILAVCIPIALWLGRIWNYINNELPGYAGYTGLGAMEIGGMSYFPSPLLQAFLEGIVLTGIMFYFWRRDQKIHWKIQRGKLSGIFLIGYGATRIIAEQFRLPDTHIGYLFGTEWVTLGILYSVPMLIVGVTLLLQKKSH